MSATSIKLRSPRHARGFTLIELMITVSIALFLVGGLLTILQNVRVTYNNQQALVQLQDEQRFALMVLTDAVQSAGYFPNPTAQDINSAFPASGNFGADAVFYGTHTAGAADNVATDTLSTRFVTALGYGPVLCNGTDSSTVAGTNNYTETFSLVAGQLMCSVNGAAPVALVNNVTAMAVYYGVKRDVALVDYNVDTYETFDNVNASDSQNISTVRVVLTFVNPLAGQTTSQPATITLERVIEVMSRAGPYT
jgi:type IV pilus assembly protein PilW